MKLVLTGIYIRILYIRNNDNRHFLKIKRSNTVTAQYHIWNHKKSLKKYLQQIKGKIFHFTNILLKGKIYCTNFIHLNTNKRLCQMLFSHHCKIYKKKSNSLMAETFICFWDQRLGVLSLDSWLFHCSSACKKAKSHRGTGEWSRDALLRQAVERTQKHRLQAQHVMTIQVNNNLPTFFN